MSNRKTIIKSNETGCLLIPDKTVQGTVFNIAYIHLNLSEFQNHNTTLNFVCNIFTLNAKCFLSFQIVKQWHEQMIPVSILKYTYFSRSKKSNEPTKFDSDAFSFTHHNTDPLECKGCYYIIQLNILGDPVDGNIIITNSLLIATVTGDVKRPL